MALALALDLGTTTITAIAVDSDGRVVAVVQRENTAQVTGLPAGHAEQRPEVLRETALAVLRELAEKLTAPAYCLGLTGQMHGVLLADCQRRPLTNLITWQDRRANEIAGGGQQSFLDAYLNRCAPESLEATGCRLSPGYLAVTLFVLQQRRRIPSAAHRAVHLADWMGAELRDDDIVTDRSNAASTGVYDLSADGWSEQLLEAGELPRSLLPDVRESGVALGGLSPPMAAATGLPSGLPVCNAIGDNQAAVLGSVPAGDPALQINVGTGGQISWPLDCFARLPGMETRYLPHHRFMLVGAGLAGGDAYAWVKRTVSAWLEDLGIEFSDEEIYRRMNTLAATVPDDADGLTCEPVFRGTRQRPSAKGTFTGIGVENFRLGHVARAVLNGIAAGMFSFYESAGAFQPQELRRIIGSGNGLRQNPLLVQALSRVFQRKVWLPVHREEAAYGAALLAGSETGVWSNLEAAGDEIRLERA